MLINSIWHLEVHFYVKIDMTNVINTRYYNNHCSNIDKNDIILISYK